MTTALVSSTNFVIGIDCGCNKVPVLDFLFHTINTFFVHAIGMIPVRALGASYIDFIFQDRIWTMDNFVWKVNNLFQSKTFTPLLTHDVISSEDVVWFAPVASFENQQGFGLLDFNAVCGRFCVLIGNNIILDFIRIRSVSQFKIRTATPVKATNLWKIAFDSCHSPCVPRILDFKFTEDGSNDAFLRRSFHFLQILVGIFFRIVNGAASAVPDSIIKCPANLEEVSRNIFESLSGSYSVTFKVVVGEFLLGSTGNYGFNEDH